MNYISTRGLFKKSWETVKANFFKIVGTTFVLFIIQSILDKATRIDPESRMTPDMGIVAFFGTILSFVIGVAITAAIIRIARGADVTVHVFSLTFLQVLRYFGAVILIMLIMTAFIIPVVATAFALGIFSMAPFVGGLTGAIFPVDITGAIIAFGVVALVAIVGFIYINMRLMFATYLIVDTNTEVIAALKQSWQLTRGEVWTIVKLALLSMLVAILGVLALLVGLLVAIPVIAFAYAHLYLALVSRNQAPVLPTHNE
ncbi:MAG: glycerophosphoryl diester phosphodiesterase membrane domain-containing protein [Minisyncoccia bacterium]